MQNFIYLVGDPQTREAAIVDPGWEVPRILETLRQDGYRPTRVFLTHTHFDHVMGLEDLLKAVDVPVHVHQAEASLVKVARSALKPLKGGETLHVGRVPISTLHTPGHTPGSQCLVVGGHLLSGDTLFLNSCGRCDLPGGDPAALYDSLSQTIKRLDDDTLLCPGHHYADPPTARLGDVKRTNPFLAIQTRQGFLQLVGAG